jgi:thioesterase domain-containing protein
VWREVLGSAALSVRDDFFALGGHSLLAVRLLSRTNSELGVNMPVSALLQAPTIELFSRQIRDFMERAQAAKSETRPALNALSFVVPIAESATKPALFCVHGAGGDVVSLREIGLGVGGELGFYGIQSRGADGTSVPFDSIEEMATAYLKEVRLLQPSGPYHLSGFCGGGLVAFEMANQLRALGETVALLVLLGSRRPGSWVGGGRIKGWKRGLARRGLRYLFERVTAFASREYAFASARLRIWLSHALRRPVPHEIRNMWLTWAFFRAESRYRPSVYAGRLTLFRPSEDPVSARDGGPEFGWAGFATEGLEVEEVPGSHETLVKQPNARVVAERLKASARNANVRAKR